MRTPKRQNIYRWRQTWFGFDTKYFGTLMIHWLCDWAYGPVSVILHTEHSEDSLSTLLPFFFSFVVGMMWLISIVVEINMSSFASNVQIGPRRHSINSLHTLRLLHGFICCNLRWPMSFGVFCVRTVISNMASVGGNNNKARNVRNTRSSLIASSIQNKQICFSLANRGDYLFFLNKPQRGVLFPPFGCMEPFHYPITWNLFAKRAAFAF